MPPVFVGALPLFIALILAFVAGAIGLGVWAMTALPGALKRRSLEARHPEADRRAAAKALPPTSRAWREGEDLHRYPDRLEELESRLIESHTEAQEQADHLRSKGERVAAKSGRDELAERYESDAGMLEQRAARMRRVMGIVWRTRVVLKLRAHVAVTARARPDLSGLPEGEIPASALEEASRAYDGGAGRVRAYVVHVENRLADLAVAVPQPPPQAEVDPEDRRAVADELDAARRTYTELQNRMDELADTLSYLADRCLTRQVVHHTSQGVEGLDGSEGLIDEVSAALAALGELAEVGDQQLADAAMDNLAEDISQLEQAGLDARAEADAALEIERLLQQFPSSV